MHFVHISLHQKYFKIWFKFILIYVHVSCQDECVCVMRSITLQCHLEQNILPGLAVDLLITL